MYTYHVPAPLLLYGSEVTWLASVVTAIEAAYVYHYPPSFEVYGQGGNDVCVLVKLANPSQMFSLVGLLQDGPIHCRCVFQSTTSLYVYRV